MYNARTFDSFIEIVLDGKHSINDIVKQNLSIVHMLNMDYLQGMIQIITMSCLKLIS